MEREISMKQETPLVSVVIPVYNAQTCLDRCLASVAGQTYQKLEIILVDDGSSDQSGEICGRWAASDPRVQVVGQENAGPGMARNTGLEHCTGAYLAFVDADDYLEPEMVERLIAAIQAKGGQVCCCGHNKLWEDGPRRSGEPPEKLVYDGREEITGFLKQVLGPPPQVTDRGFAGTNVWAVLYDMALFADGQIRFRREHGSLCEDLFFNLAVFKRADRVVVVPEFLYNYQVNQGSLMQSYRADRFARAKGIRALLKKELAEELGQYPALRQHLDRNYLDFLVGCMKVEVQSRHQIGEGRCRRELVQMIRDRTTQSVLRRYPVRQMEPKQRILFSLIKRRCVLAVYWLFRIRYRI